ncbi:hypothetical protein PGT21_028499 [Puccinia graminis f. sp. tritici]|uniref:Uncharacterized protein n=1 Tax=Puccinia graminis f. sp. tritici TaxID=56615 RepID=A0A5B0PFN9_PUCGR|nr:hypothetical protein PGT21_028499 [Puccinia graminis f. sp. tritici]KAA1128132.1 hypothetical protein PGTUg99_014146 [Puccinia graminis f. sp. tritici]
MHIPLILLFGILAVSQTGAVSTSPVEKLESEENGRQPCPHVPKPHCSRCPVRC